MRFKPHAGYFFPALPCCLLRLSLAASGISAARIKAAATGLEQVLHCSRPTRTRQRSWQNWYLTRSGSTAELWSHQAMGDMQLAQPAAMLHTDRSELVKLLQQAEAAYKQIEARGP